MPVKKIITSYDFPPIPIRCFDWSAYQDGWEPGLPFGRGPTREAAIADLLEQLNEEEE
jgi:hypothetical protein